jgi:hypothetical protein
MAFSFLSDWNTHSRRGDEIFDYHATATPKTLIQLRACGA